MRLLRITWAVAGIALAILVLWLVALVLLRVTLDGEWLLRAGTLDGSPISRAANHPTTLGIDGGRFGGRAPCNEYNGYIDMSVGLLLDASRGSLHMHDTFRTLALCLDDSVMQSEADYLAALARVSHFQRDGSRLILSGSGVELQFDLNTSLAPTP